MKTIVTFGEVMGRLCPPGMIRLRQGLPGSLDLTFGGAESNVAASIAVLGGKARFVSALPTHDVALACKDSLRALGVDTHHILASDKGRLGLYFLEGGAVQRPSRVVYDRSDSSISLTDGNDYDWDAAYADAQWLHFTGITPSLSKTAAEACMIAAKAAKAKGLTVSCDLNFRKKLWKWDESLAPRELAEKTMRELLPYIDVVIANEEDAGDVLSIHAENTDVHSGKVDAAKYASVAEQIVAQFPNVKKVAITLRESVSASHNNWGAMLYDAEAKSSTFAPMVDGEYSPYQTTHIVDRVGGGDSFGAALIFGLTTEGIREENQQVIDFAVASSCLAHTMVGDINFSTREEVEALLNSGGSGRVVR